jgi:metal-responsive CopG/Arc/MetJ family transcriptional regulator
MGMSGPKERATFSIDRAVKEELDTRIAKSGRSRFVEKAIAEALRQQAVEEFKQFLDSIQGYSHGAENSTDYLRRKRLEWDGRPPDVLQGREK